MMQHLKYLFYEDEFNPVCGHVRTVAFVHTPTMFKAFCFIHSSITGGVRPEMLMKSYIFLFVGLLK